MDRRVVITGIGLQSPMGDDRTTSWQHLLAGRRAVQRLVVQHGRGRLTVLGARVMARQNAPVAPAALRHPAAAGSCPTDMEASGLDLRFAPDRPEPPEIAVDVDESLDPTLFDYGRISSGAAEHADRMILLGLRAADEAVRQAGLMPLLRKAGGAEAAYRRSCVVGSSKGSLDAALAVLDQLHEDGEVDPRLWDRVDPSALQRRLSVRYGLTGPGGCPVAACATGLYAVIEAAELVAQGRADFVLAGSADSSLNVAVAGSYRRLGVLAPAEGDDDPAAAVRPFAADRQGFALGEGAGMFVLEDYEHAVNRGAVVLAEVAGWARLTDAASITALPATPEAAVRAMKHALEQAKLRPAEVDHLNTHGTATASNDPWEAAALREMFGAHLDRLSLVANKAQIGHLLGAAGSVELAFTLLALTTGWIPPTCNQTAVDPDCALPGFTPQALTANIKTAVKVSYGFGGPIAAVVLRRPTR